MPELPVKTMVCFHNHSVTSETQANRRNVLHHNEIMRSIAKGYFSSSRSSVSPSVLRSSEVKLSSAVSSASNSSSVSANYIAMLPKVLELTLGNIKVNIFHFSSLLSMTCKCSNIPSTCLPAPFPVGKRSKL